MDWYVVYRQVKGADPNLPPKYIEVGKLKFLGDAQRLMKRQNGGYIVKGAEIVEAKKVAI